MSIQTFLLAGVTSYADPGDWNVGNNVVQCIGPGGSGSLRRTTARGGFGGGGGAHAADANVAPAFPVATTVPAGTSQTKTSFGTYVVADFGVDGTTTAGGTGGATVNGTGTAAYMFAGGAATYAGTGSPGGGGAGAGGPHGAGQASATTGGSAANGTTAPNPTASVAAGVAGRVGAQWDASHGPGSGAGGATLTGAATGIGLVGGAFGGGGSGCHSGYTGSTLGVGGDGLIAITREYASCRNILANSAFTNAAISGTPGTPNNIVIGGTGVTAVITAIGKDANGLPMITYHVSGGGGTSTRVDMYFTSAAAGSGVTVLPSIPYNLSIYHRLSAGALTNITGVDWQGNSHNSSTYLSTTPSTSFSPTSTQARATATAVLPATSTNSLVNFAVRYAAGAAIDLTLELSGAQFEIGDTASAALPTPVLPYSRMPLYQPLLAQ